MTKNFQKANYVSKMCVCVCVCVYIYRERERERKRARERERGREGEIHASGNLRLLFQVNMKRIVLSAGLLG